MVQRRFDMEANGLHGEAFEVGQLASAGRPRFACALSTGGTGRRCLAGRILPPGVPRAQRFSVCSDACTVCALRRIGDGRQEVLVLAARAAVTGWRLASPHALAHRVGLLCGRQRQRRQPQLDGVNRLAQPNFTLITAAVVAAGREGP